MSYSLGFDPTESESKCEELRLVSALSTPVSASLPGCISDTMSIAKYCCEGSSDDDSVRETFFSHSSVKESIYCMTLIFGPPTIDGNTSLGL